MVNLVKSWAIMMFVLNSHISCQTSTSTSTFITVGKTLKGITPTVNNMYIYIYIYIYI